MTTSRRPDRGFTDPQILLSTTAEAAFASDAKGRITIWNQAAQALFGVEASQVIGKRCYETIRGRDVFGNRFCDESCAVRGMRRRREPIHPFELLVATGAGDTRKVRCSVIVISLPRGGGYSVIHLMQPLENAAGSDGCGGALTQSLRGALDSSDARAGLPDPVPRLTVREVQVLRLVASGTTTREIAATLGIARSTVDNHIQHILDRLDVSSKLQAVFVARRDNLI